MAIVGVLWAFLLILSVVQTPVSDCVSCRECPPFWTRFGYYCYRFFGTPKTWQQSESHCQEFFNRRGEGHLATVQNEEQNNFLEQLWSSSLVPRDGFSGERVWIGANDFEQEGRFQWSDGTHFGFTKWHADEPNNSGDEDCLQFYRRSSGISWNDDLCSRLLPYFCKILVP